MRIVTLIVGALETNCYLAVDEQSGLAAVIDPGAEAALICRTCERERLTPVFILNTHAHADHIGANAEVKRRYPDARLGIGRGDAPLLANPVRNLSVMLGGTGRMPKPDLLLDEGQTLTLGACTLRVLETPGHTQGAVCLVADAERPPVVFCGDLIFQDGVGRTDLPGGDPDELARSIREKIFALPDETVLLPGHGPSTSVGDQKASNPLAGES